MVDRNYERIPTDVRSKVVVSGGKTYFEAWYSLTNVSDGGVFAEGGALLPPGTEVRLSIPVGEEHIEVTGRVAHKRADDDAEWGVGIQLVPHAPGLAARLS